MNIHTIEDVLKNNTYPGRGIIIGKSDDGKKAVIAYFIMGRSENSRNRVFTDCGDKVITEAHDPSKMVDPSLIIYAPVRKLESATIVTNGDQTDTVYDFIKEGKTFEEALRTRTFEPDAPNYTPRISGIVEMGDKDFGYKLSILKSCGGNAESAERFFYEYSQPVAGQGRFIHTYRCDGNPIPSFEGEPEAVYLGNEAERIADDIWKHLNADNKVSLFVRTIDIATKEEKTVIINKNR